MASTLTINDMLTSNVSELTEDELLSVYGGSWTAAQDTSLGVEYGLGVLTAGFMLANPFLVAAGAAWTVNSLIMPHMAY